MFPEPFPAPVRSNLRCCGHSRHAPCAVLTSHGPQHLLHHCRPLDTHLNSTTDYERGARRGQLTQPPLDAPRGQHIFLTPALCATRLPLLVHQQLPPRHIPSDKCWDYWSTSPAYRKRTNRSSRPFDSVAPTRCWPTRSSVPCMRVACFMLWLGARLAIDGC